jgi:hypothetical protein
MTTTPSAASCFGPPASPSAEWHLDFGNAFRHFAFHLGAWLSQPVVMIAALLSEAGRTDARNGPACVGFIDEVSSTVSSTDREQRLWPSSLVRVVGGPWCWLARPIGLEVVLPITVVAALHEGSVFQCQRLEFF